MKPGAPRPPAGRMLAFDTSTGEAVVALGAADGTSVAQEYWPAGHLHGERLLVSVERGLLAAGATPQGLAAIAFGLGIPVVGIATPLALVAADAVAGEDGARSRLTVVFLPAGPNGRYRTIVRCGRGGAVRLAGRPVLMTAETDPAIPQGARMLALDLPTAPGDARVAGERARRGLGEALLRLGAGRLAAEGADDLAELVPMYATLPRGAAATGGTIAWSPGRR